VRIREVIPGKLYWGGRTDKIPTAILEREFSQRRISTVVNLWGTQKGLDGDPNAAGVVRRYCHRPVPCGRVTPSFVTAVTGIVDEVITALDAGEVVYVHCLVGRQRSGLIIALVLMRLNPTLSGKAALATVRGIRLSALTNPHFVTYLETLP